jgi:phospholipid N-methyltransferase
MQEHFEFLRQFVQHPLKIGAIAPASPCLIEAMLAPVPWKSCQHLVEYGPGTGPVTRRIVKHLPAYTQFDIFESDEYLAKRLGRMLPGLRIWNESAQNIRDRVSTPVDAVISSLPFATIPETVGTDIVRETARALKSGGLFVTYVYFHSFLLPKVRLWEKCVRGLFASVEVQWVWLNVPPAFVFVCRKAR